MAQPHVESFYDPATNNITHIVSDPASKCALASPMLSRR